LDIGANLGLVSLRMAARVGHTGHVHSFEPQSRLLHYLRKTRAQNPHLSLTLHPVALGPEEATMTMCIPEGNAGAGSLSKSFSDRRESEEVAVPVKRLDDYAKEIGIGRIDFIKMDVEGFEAQVLLGAMDIIGRTKPRVIVLEENQPRRATGLAPALNMLTEADYDLFALPRQFLSVNLLPVTQNCFSHDFVGVSKTADSELRRALGIQNQGSGRSGRNP
jgi:FkbM family methyltransferase